MPRKGGLKSEEVERFVELVRQRPLIYDCSRDDHMDNVKIENTWRFIAEKMGGNFTGKFFY
jgi:hypothetical protein